MRTIINNPSPELKQQFSREPIVVVDTETTGLSAYRGDRVFAASLYLPTADTSWFIPSGTPAYKWLIQRLCKKPTVMFNAKFDLHMLYADGMHTNNAPEDVMIMAHLCNENEALSNGGTKGAYTLKRLARKYLGEHAVQDEAALFEAGKRHKLDAKGTMHKLYEVEPAIVADYAMSDVELTWQLREELLPTLEEWGLVDLYLMKCRAQFYALFQMERNGLLIDMERLEQDTQQIAPRMQELFDAIMSALRSMGFSGEFNPGSPVQVKSILRFLGYDVNSTGKDVLEALAPKEPVAEMLLQYRLLSKAQSTYYTPYKQLIGVDGRIHHQLNSTGTVTGRLSSSGPNLQNVPRKENKKGHGAYSVKAVFAVDPGKVMFQVDYNAFELRVATHFCRQEQMREAFNTKADPHQITADALHVTRDEGKRFNFGLLYGMGPDRAMVSFGLSREDAKKYVYGWRKLYPEFVAGMQFYSTLAEQKRSIRGDEPGPYQYVRIPGGRVRRFHEYEENLELPPYFAAFNFVVQGTCAYILEKSLLEIATGPYRERIMLLNVVHDSIIFQTDRDDTMEILEYVEEVMTDHPYNPKLAVSIEYSTTNWMNMKKWPGYIED